MKYDYYNIMTNLIKHDMYLIDVKMFQQISITRPDLFVSEIQVTVEYRI